MLDEDHIDQVVHLLAELVDATESRFGGMSEEGRAAAALAHTAVASFECALHAHRSFRALGLERRAAWIGPTVTCAISSGSGFPSLRSVPCLRP